MPYSLVMGIVTGCIGMSLLHTFYYWYWFFIIIEPPFIWYLFYNIERSLKR